ncbi:potassium-transporting ATPase subunit KdpC [Janthinobacterium sp. B9-8]|uniref:potassium-transporting ATPase subunit KdpC n=1 Tax=Janthinobacterium sp. B9-8 TaxID=1236179 RepID=UPI00061D2E69|nr:potassium-transporting ATPase subunit KdpC [Janthinobacterium sp. B9-8]AMC37022.1 potassium-transporting ATPase subunit C [Janthinobacterium sp. B9-8]
MNTQLRPALVIFALLSVVTGLAYPLLVTGISQATMPDQANGSLVQLQGKAVGSSLIGQNFSEPQYFWGRPSATGPMAYNAGGSSGSNLGPTNPALLDTVQARVDALKKAHPNQAAAIPVDLVTASGSGLDPHISVAAARYQLERVSVERKLSSDKVGKLVEENTEGRQFGLFGEPRVNVLKLNIALDQQYPLAK